MTRSALALLALACLVAGTALTQPVPSGPGFPGGPTAPLGVPRPPVKPAEPPEVKTTPSVAKVPVVPEFDVSFADGSNVKATFLEPSIDITTKYGKLTVPCVEMRRVELGFRYPEGVEARVAAAIERLGDPAFERREAAEKELTELKEHVVPLLKKAGADSNAERRRRADDLLKALRPGLPVDRVNAKDYDSIETAEFTVRGRIDVATLKVRTKQFGEATLKLNEVKQLRAAFSTGGGGEITVDSARYAKLNWSAWLDTGIDANSETGLEVTATGQIDQWPQEPGRYLSGPAGTGAPAPNAPQAIQQGRMINGRQMVGPNGMPAGMLTAGSLVGKVGESGMPFLIGDSYKQPRAPGTGRLFVTIAPSQWNNENCLGEYKVRVKVGE